MKFLFPEGKIDRELCGDEAERKEHIELLVALTSNANPKHNVFEHLYQNLTILDTKTAALLQFNSVMLAIAAIIVTVEQNAVAKFLFAVPVVVFLISGLTSLRAIYVHWASKAQLQDVDDYLGHLLELRDARTRKYRMSWRFSLVGILLLFGCFILVLSLHIVPVFLQWLNHCS